MKTIIIEDEPQAISALKQELVLNCPEIQLLDIAQTVKEGVEKIKKLKPELIFLDIQLSDGLGFDILQKLKTINFKVIFTTAYSEYALQAIKFSALDYLLKPIDSQELRVAVEKASKWNQKYLNTKVAAFLYNQSNKSSNKKIALHSSNGFHIYDTSTIIKCNSDGNYTHIYFEDGKKILIAKTLKNLEKLLVPFNFERIHHSYLINMNHLVSYINKDGGYVVLSDKTTLPVSQRKKTMFIKRLEKFNQL